MGEGGIRPGNQSDRDCLGVGTPDLDPREPLVVLKHHVVANQQRLVLRHARNQALELLGSRVLGLQLLASDNRMLCVDGYKCV